MVSFFLSLPASSFSLPLSSHIHTGMEPNDIAEDLDAQIASMETTPTLELEPSGRFDLRATFRAEQEALRRANERRVRALLSPPTPNTDEELDRLVDNYQNRLDERRRRQAAPSSLLPAPTRQPLGGLPVTFQRLGETPTLRRLLNDDAAEEDTDENTSPEETTAMEEENPLEAVERRRRRGGGRRRALAGMMVDPVTGELVPTLSDRMRVRSLRFEGRPNRETTAPPEALRRAGTVDENNTSIEDVDSEDEGDAQRDDESWLAALPTFHLDEDQLEYLGLSGKGGRLRRFTTTTAHLRKSMIIASRARPGGSLPFELRVILSPTLYAVLKSKAADFRHMLARGRGRTLVFRSITVEDLTEESFTVNSRALVSAGLRLYEFSYEFYLNTDFVNSRTKMRRVLLLHAIVDLSQLQEACTGSRETVNAIVTYHSEDEWPTSMGLRDI